MTMPRLGQGTWRMGEAATAKPAEIAALRHGLDLGLTLIDTAEMYAEGGSERVIGEAIAGRRDSAFLVSKAYPQNAGRTSLPQACRRSLERLGTERLDLYLLHWRGAVKLAETVAAMEALREGGQIGAWGVSNFDRDDMEELFALPGGRHCVANQVLYHPGARGIEFDLLPWCADHGVTVMAYSPLGQAGALLRAPALTVVARRHTVSPAQVAIAWGLRHPCVVSIPKATTPAHVAANAAAGRLTLTPDDLTEIDRAFPPPRRAERLETL